MKNKSQYFSYDKNSSLLVTSYYSRFSSLKDKSLSNTNKEDSNEKKSIKNVNTIFQMNNMKKDYKNIFNKQLNCLDKKEKISLNYDFVLPLNNSIDEKIGLDKIEFIDQRNLGNLNINDLELLNKKTTVDYSSNSNYQTNYISNCFEKSEKNINIDLNISNNNTNIEDFRDFKVYKNNNLDIDENLPNGEVDNNIIENNFIDHFDVNNISNNHKSKNKNKLNNCSLKYENNNINCIKEIISKSKTSKDKEIISKSKTSKDKFIKDSNNMIRKIKEDKRINFAKNYKLIPDQHQYNNYNRYIENVSTKTPEFVSQNLKNIKNSFTYKSYINEEALEKKSNQVIKKNSILFCDYDAETFEENIENTLNKKTSSSFIRISSKKDLNKSFIKNANDLNMKKINNRMNSCDNIFLKNNHTMNKTINNVNIQLKQNSFNNRFKCDVETHYTTTNNNKSKKDIPRYSYSNMKNNYKNIENYTSPILDNSITKYKNKKLEDMDKEYFTRFLLNNYLTNLTQEKYEKEFSNINNNKNFSSTNLHNYYSNSLNNDNINFKDYSSVKEKIEDLNFCNNNNDISPNRYSTNLNNFNNISSINLYNSNHENYESFNFNNINNKNNNINSNNLDSEIIEAVKNYPNKNISNKDNNISNNIPQKRVAYLNRFCRTIQSQTESDNKSENNIICDSKRISASTNNAALYENKENFNSNNLDLNFSNYLKDEMSEINVCPECEVNEIPKYNLFKIDDIFYNEKKNKNNYLNSFEINPNFPNNSIPINNISYSFLTSLRNSHNKNESLQNNNTNNNFLRNTINFNNQNNSNLSNQMQNGYLQNNISNQLSFFDNNNINNLLRRSYSNKLINNNLNYIDNNNISSEAQQIRNSKSFNREENDKTIRFSNLKNSANNSKNNFYSNNQNSNIKYSNSNNHKKNNDNNNINNFVNSNPFVSKSEYFSNIKNQENLQGSPIDKNRNNISNKIFYLCSPPTSIIKRKEENKTNERYYSLKQKISDMNISNLNNTNDLDAFEIKNKFEFGVKNSSKFLDLEKEVISLKKDRKDAKMINLVYENELKIKNSQLDKLQNNLKFNKTKLSKEKKEIKNLEMKIGILTYKLENLDNKKQPNKKVCFITNSSITNNNISNYLNSSLNKSSLLSKHEIELKKSLKLINKNTKKKKSKNTKDEIE